MTFLRIGTLVCGFTFLLVACSEREPVAAAATDPSLPTQAQPRLTTMKLYVGAEELTAEIARRPKEIQTGMMFRTNVTDDDAMLFVLSQPSQAGFWMKNCPEPLSCAYINPDGIIEEIHPMEPFNTNPITSEVTDVLFVLETDDGWFDRNNVRTGMLIRTEYGSLLDTFFRSTTR